MKKQVKKAQRRYVYYDEVKRKHPQLRKALGLTKQTWEQTDVLVFEFNNRLYVESHDEYSFAEWTGAGKLVELDWAQRAMTI